MKTLVGLKIFYLLFLYIKISIGFLTRVLTLINILSLFSIAHSICSAIANIKERVNKINKNQLVETLNSLFYRFRRQMKGFCGH